MDEAGEMRWELLGCLALAWTVVAIVLIRGISSLGKVGACKEHILDGAVV